MKTALMVLIIIASSLGLAKASLILSYNTDGLTGSEGFLSGTAPDAAITALNLTRGSGLSSQNGADSFNSKSWNSETTPPINDTEYFEFGFSVNATSSVNLTNLLITTRSSNSGPGTLRLYSSLDNFATSLATFSQSGETFLDSDINLSSLTILPNTTIRFRVIEFGNSNAGGTGNGSTSAGGTFRLTNYQQNAAQPITLNGTVVTVPEPTCLVLLFSGLGGLYFWRRRSTRS